MGGSFGKKKSKIIIVGLDNSGKSTMINMLKPKKVSYSINYLNRNIRKAFSFLQFMHHFLSNEL
jgi:GTPase SAR1 family protein